MLEPSIAAKRPWTSPTVTVLPFRATANSTQTGPDAMTNGFSVGGTTTASPSTTDSTTGICFPLPGIPIGHGSSKTLFGVKDGTGADNHCAPSRTVSAPS